MNKCLLKNDKAILEVYFNKIDYGRDISLPLRWSGSPASGSVMQANTLGCLRSKQMVGPLATTISFCN